MLCSIFILNSELSKSVLYFASLILPTSNGFYGYCAFIDENIIRFKNIYCTQSLVACCCVQTCPFHCFQRETWHRSKQKCYPLNLYHGSLGQNSPFQRSWKYETECSIWITQLLSSFWILMHAFLFLIGSGNGIKLPALVGSYLWWWKVLSGGFDIFHHIMQQRSIMGGNSSLIVSLMNCLDHDYWEGVESLEPVCVSI